MSRRYRKAEIFYMQKSRIFYTTEMTSFTLNISNESCFFYRLIFFGWCYSVSNEKIFSVIPYIPPNSVTYLLECISIPKHMPTRHCQIETLKSVWNILLIIFHENISVPISWISNFIDYFFLSKHQCNYISEQ